MSTSWFRRRRHYQSFTHQPLPVSWYQYSLFHPLTYTTTINIKSLFISAKYSKIIQIAVHICNIFKNHSNRRSYLKIIQNFSKASQKSSKMIDFPHKLHYGRYNANELQATWDLQNMHVIWASLVHMFTLSINWCPPLRHPARAFRKAPGSTELTCFCAPTWPS